MALAIPGNPGVRAERTPACTLQDLLSAHCDWQPVDDGESYKCKACSATVPGHRKFHLAAAGELLCVEIKRFQNSISKAGVLQYSRVETAIGLPLELRLAGQDYQLRSVIMHSGPTPYCGHYCAAVADEQRWLVYDDARVSESRSIPSEAERACVFVVYVRYGVESTSSERINTGVASSGGCVSAVDADPSTGEACGTSVRHTGEPGQPDRSDTHVEDGEAPVTNQDAESCAEVSPADSRAQRVVSEGERSEACGGVGEASMDKHGSGSSSGQIDGFSAQGTRQPSKPKHMSVRGEDGKGSVGWGGIGGSRCASMGVSSQSDQQTVETRRSHTTHGPTSQVASTTACLRLCSRCGKNLCIGQFRGVQPCGPDAGMHECALCARIHRELMNASEVTSPWRLEKDVQQLLQLFREGGDCFRFLAELPMFLKPDVAGATGSLLADSVRGCEVGIRSLASDKVNSSTALAVRSYYADAHVYPLVVLMEATGVATGQPSVFLLDIFETLTHSVLNRDFHVQLGRWRSKSRHWMVGTANVGEGKSHGMKTFVEKLLHVLNENSAFAVGKQADRWHLCQSSTTAAALDKMRHSHAHVLIHCSDAARCLHKGAANQGKTDPYQHVDLDYFLDAAHGDEVSHATMVARQNALKKKVTNPKEPLQDIEGVHMDPTNVHVMFLQQDCLFIDFWAKITVAAPVGLAQRCLLSFAGDMDPPGRELNAFEENITVPIVHNLFTCVVRRLGPRMQSMSCTSCITSSAQGDAVAELEEILKLHARAESLPECFRAAMPKAMYWLGTSILSNHILSQCWGPSLLALQGWASGQRTRKDVDAPSFVQHVNDDAFSASVAFVHRRYLAGQAVLGVTVSEEAWLGHPPAAAPSDSDLMPLLVRVLRGVAGPYLRATHVLNLDLAMKRALRAPGTEVAENAKRRLAALWRLCEDVGVGVLKAESDGEGYIHKYRRDGLSSKTLSWLQKQRIPGHIFGTADPSPDPEERRSAKPEMPRPRSSGSMESAPIPGGYRSPGAACPEHTVGVALSGHSSAPATAASAGPTPTTKHSGEQPGPFISSGGGDPENSCLSVVPVQGAGTEIVRPAVEKNLIHEVIPGVLLTRPQVRQRLREFLDGQNQRHEVADVKPLSHDHFFLVRGVCLGSAGHPCPVSWRGTYYRHKYGCEAKTWIIKQLGDHLHQGAGHGSGRLFTPLQKRAAEDILRGSGKIGFRAFLTALKQKCGEDPPLPAEPQMQSWLKRNAPKAPADTREDVRQVTLEMSLAQWEMRDAQRPSDIILTADRTLTPDLLFIPFTCPGMRSTLSRYAAQEACLVVDVKMSVLDDARGIASAGLLVKDAPTLTCIGTDAKGKKVMACALSSHVRIFAMAAFHSESIPHWTAFLHFVCREWARARPQDPRTFEQVVRQINKDHHPAIEAARHSVLPSCRPLDDWWHFMDKESVIASMLNAGIGKMMCM